MNTPAGDSHRFSSIDRCNMVELERHYDAEGSVCVAENVGGALFPVRRVYYLYDVPSDAARGGHSHFALRQLIVAISGSFDVCIDDGIRRRTVTLNRPYRALYIDTGIWRTIDNFSSGAVCLVLASEPYDESDYVRDYDRFLELTSEKRQNND